MKNSRVKSGENVPGADPSEDEQVKLIRSLTKTVMEKWLHLEAISIYFLGRYGMTALEFYQARIKDKPHSWEEEDTYFDWVTAEDQIPGIKKEIRKLEEFLLRADDQ